MHALFETSDILQLVVNYVGFSPSRFYLRECSRFLHDEISEVMFFSEADFFDAVHSNLVNPKYVKLREKTLSDELILRLVFQFQLGSVSTCTLKAVLEGRSFRELRNSGVHPEVMLEYSVLCIDVPIFDSALKCMESDGISRKSCSGCSMLPGPNQRC